jgi:hypothetical protein
MNRNRLAFVAGTFLITMVLTIAGHTQQTPRSFSWKEDDGSLSRLDLNSGFINTGKAGTKSIITPGEMDKDCDTWEEMLLTETAHLCDIWAELKPKTQIERLPFSKFIYRLLKFSAPGTNFSRYVGLELNSDKTAFVYDALLVPSDLGKDVSCTITQGRGDSSSITIYRCTLKTMAYPLAVQTEKALVSQLSNLHLVENQAEEHGLLVKDKNNNECAPTGECMHGQMFMSAPQDGKVLRIEAQPDFVRDLALDVQVMLMTGHHNFVKGVSPNSGTVEISIWSVTSHSPDH